MGEGEREREGIMNSLRKCVLSSCLSTMVNKSHLIVLPLFLEALPLSTLVTAVAAAVVSEEGIGRLYLIVICGKTSLFIFEISQG